MTDEPSKLIRRERWLAVAGAAGFALIAAAAGLLWVREGDIVFVARILGQLANCL